MDSLNIRPSALAGAWYPDDPQDLRMSVEAFLARGRSVIKEHEQRLLALILPHAGHKYSGRTTGAGVAMASREPAAWSRIILMGPSHRAFVQGAVLAGASFFETPLGRVPVDRAAVAKLMASGVSCADGPHEKEHCLEILLPFFQVAFKPFQIVPLLLGKLSDTDRRRLAAGLRDIVDDRTLLVASSDFVHYGADFDYLPPVGPDVQAGVREIDEGAVKRIRALNAAGLLSYRRTTGATICGIMPIAVLLDTLPHGTTAELLDYSQSAEVTGETDHMVSYAALAFFQS
ncbi:MAG: AmmeMemoRadiSam system protein B [Candidatus Lindowbacteria bacterium RIFCSPLOWO2_12_FULL_62_27]|nr:MAG: AmmeMemoRadiSam system protein B [Candidatus Lindowbacteria bacterium RIFCSPLOWO2_12_FULL_62_27]